MSDIVDRLRAGTTDGSHLRWTVTPIHLEAADEIERLRKALVQSKKSMRNARGAIESNQVIDKDVHGTLSRAIAEIDAALVDVKER